MSLGKAFFGIMRVPFLILTPACVLLGLGTAVWAGKEINPLYLILAMVGAISAHISVNSFNEYFDFKSGLDSLTIKTPFSGGSGTLQTDPKLARLALIISWTSLVITAGIGLFFCFVWSFIILPLGAVGLFLLYAYTIWFTRNPILCLIAPGLGFGIIMVVSTYFALTGEFSPSAFIVSLVPFFLVSNLLLLNQFPDVEADQSVGKKHFPILIGRRASSILYAVFLLGAYVSIVAGTVLGYLPLWSLIGLGTIVAAIPATLGAFRNSENIGKLIPSLGLNVIINILTPVLVSIGLFIG